MIKYVVGFAFSFGITKVVLIRKNNPSWQKGLLNGIGGKIKNNESRTQAMAREIYEETGVKTKETQWLYFAQMTDYKTFCVDCFSIRENIDKCHTTTNEPIEIIEINHLKIKPIDTIENLTWLISLAIDSILDERPKFTKVEYPNAI